MFIFKQFAIDDSAAAMKIGTDGVLLGSWAFADIEPRNILDVGTGSGLISLMMAQRFSYATITALEIDPITSRQAEQNIATSRWASRIVTITADFSLYTPDISFDAIVSNPPFFDEPLSSPDQRRAAARHESALSIETLIRHSATMLNQNGHIALIAPYHRTESIIYNMAMNHLDAERVTTVHSDSRHQPIRVLIEARKGTAQRFEKQHLSIRDNNTYSKKYIELTKQFYLPQTFK